MTAGLGRDADRSNDPPWGPTLVATGARLRLETNTIPTVESNVESAYKTNGGINRAHMVAEDIDQLVKRAQLGDRKAFRKIVLVLEKDLRFYLAAFEASNGMIDEVLQATFVTAFKKISLYRGEGALSTWLRTIARNHLLKALQHQKRFTELTGDALEALVVHSELEDIERIEELEIQTRKLRVCMERLPPPLRALVQGRYTDELSMGRLAERFGRTDIWVRVTLCRIRKVLRRCIEANKRP